MTNLILCGGSGTRLWPISRTLFPKQFVKLFNNKSLFQLTIDRNLSICTKSIISTSVDHYFLASDQMDEISRNADSYVLEPFGKNTAPAIALTCLALDKNEIVLVTPSDHLIKNQAEYISSVKEAQILANDGNLVMFGIKPKFPETGFGYIESVDGNVKKFHEKPDLQTAQNYLNMGNFYWNSGIFMFKAGVFLEELKRHSTDIFESCVKAFASATKDNGLIRIKHNDMAQIPENSIDYAVLEKSSKSKMVVCNDIGWSDLGSFDALSDEFPKDKCGNTLDNNYISVDSNNNFIYSTDRKIATIDIKDCVIVDSEDALLISSKGSSQKVKKVVEQLQRSSKELCDTHLTTYRPWGKFTVLESGVGYKIKKIEVAPSKRLSLQKHFHRSEHWIVVSGIATVIIEGNSQVLRANESTYIKAGEIHRLENNGMIPVVLIEVQVGEYVGEDDICRIEDDFKRWIQ